MEETYLEAFDDTSNMILQKQSCETFNCMLFLGNEISPNCVALFEHNANLNSLLTQRHKAEIIQHQLDCYTESIWCITACLTESFCYCRQNIKDTPQPPKSSRHGKKTRLLLCTYSVLHTHALK